MNYGPLIFLAAFFALGTSWLGLVLTPVIQLGSLQPTNTLGVAAAYPVARPGLAREGLEVYRANGCAACHSQQVGQLGTVFDVMLTEAGTNRAALTDALARVRPETTAATAAEWLSSMPKAVLQGVTREAADNATKALNAAGGKSQAMLVPLGPDIARGWGRRRTVAEDFLYDDPVMLGSQRVGPDMANVGLGKPDTNWQLRHLYAPRAEVKDSTMPPHRFLFETRRLEHGGSPEALVLPAPWRPAAGYEIVPKPEARALVAYLLSLRADAPLFVAPLNPALAAPAEGTATNAPAK